MKTFTKLILFSVFVVFTITGIEAQNWYQMSNHLYGYHNNDEFGFSVDLNSDGTIMAVGAPFNAENGVSAGCVTVFKWNGTQWDTLGHTIFADDEFWEFGFNVRLNEAGNILAVGANYSSIGAYCSGHVTVYQYNGNDWVRKGNRIYDNFQGDAAGIGLALNASGNIIAVGYAASYQKNYLNGKVKVFELVDTLWVQLGDTIYGTENSLLGTGLSMNSEGTRIAVGAPYDKHVGENGGMVCVFDYNGTDWTLVGDTIYPEAPADFGYDVSLTPDGNTLAVGAPNGNPYHQGYVQVFQYDGTSWVQKGTNINGTDNAITFGESLQLNGDGSYLIIGAPCLIHKNKFVSRDYESYMRVVHFNGTDWEQVGEQIEMTRSDCYGSSVAISNDGSIIAVGAQGKASGCVFPYKLIDDSGIDENGSGNINVYPNPAQNVVTVKAADLQKVEIYDLTGKKITEHYFDGNPGKINLPDNGNRMFLFKVITAKGYYSVPVLKK